MPSLYLFLHGLFVTRQREYDIELVKPDVPGHLYLAGSWLEETAVERDSTLYLRGVQTGPADIKAAGSMIYLPGLKLSRRQRAATVWVPRPRRILSLLIATRPPDSAFGPHAIRKVPGAVNVVCRADRPGEGWPRIAGVLVFVYDYADENQVQLEGHYWEPASTGGAISLHLISTSVTAEGRSHEQATDDALREVMPGYPGLVFESFATHPAWNAVGDPNFGDLSGFALPAPGAARTRQTAEAVTRTTGGYAFSLAELEAIPSRARRLGWLGRIKKDGRPLDGLWQEPEPLNEVVTNCGDISL